jgi:general stress protein 26
MRLTTQRKGARMSNSTSDQQTLWELIRDIKFGMLTHRHGNGMLHSLPLTTQNKSSDEGAALYFFISRKSELVQSLQQDGNVNVSYSNPGDDRYVSVSGLAAISEDAAKKEALWSAMAKAWFPGGVTDPDLVLLEVGISHAEYWDVKESKMVQLAKMAKAAVTGERPALGEHKEVRVS